MSQLTLEVRTMRFQACLYALLFVIYSPLAFAQPAGPPTEWPLMTIDELIYEGAFRLPSDEFGASSLNFSEGPIAYVSDRNSLIVVGHSHHQALAEFAIPTLVQSSAIADLNMAADPLQVFSTVLDRASEGNPQSMDRIGGLMVVDYGAGAQLLVNAYEYYDAPGDNTHTTLRIDDPENLASAGVDGFFHFAGGAGHTSGWMSPIPADWQNYLGGTHLTGQSSGIPIISRTSVGPSAFSFYPSDVLSASSTASPVPTKMLLDFTLDDPLHDDLENSSGSNDSGRISQERFMDSLYPERAPI